MTLITGNQDLENYLLKFVDPKTLLLYATLSKHINDFVKKNNVYKLIQLYAYECNIVPHKKNNILLLSWALINNYDCIYKWLENNFNFSDKLIELNMNGTLPSIVKNGHLDSLIFFIKYFPEQMNNNIYLFPNAVIHGHVNILIWMSKHYHDICNFDVAYGLARISKCQNVLDWLDNNNK